MNNPAAVYVHIPFCVNKCPYCSFAVTINQTHREGEYMEALEREAEAYGGKAVSIYVGGGTPSCLSTAMIIRLMEFLRRRFPTGKESEITFEINPESLDAEKAAALKECGVTRISMGVQSLNDKTLEALGRPHRRSDALAAFALLRRAGFDNINVDFMYGLPGQERSEVAGDLGAVIGLGSEHLSLYALNIEPKSLFYARRMDVDQDSQGELYSLVCRQMAAAGLLQYEVSNFSRPGFESRHNINYWEGGEYIGLGMSAHSHLAGERFWNADTLPKYLNLIASTGTASVDGERLAPADKMGEAFLFALRMNRGADLGALEKKFGLALSETVKERIESFMDMGLLEERNDRICATAKGRLVLDEISARII